MATISGWILCLVGLPLWLQGLVFLLIGFATINTIIGQALLGYPWSLAGLYINAKNELNVIRKDGQVLYDVSLQSDSVVTPILTVIHFQAKQALWYQRFVSQRILVLPDSLDAESFRQLRVWLLWGKKGK